MSKPTSQPEQPQPNDLSPSDPASVADASEPGGRGFSARLREATKTIHRDAERSGFIADLIRGRATRWGYATYLRNLVPVYSRLETRLDTFDPPSPLLAPFAASGLRRLPALIADLEALAGTGWSQECPLLPEAEIYAQAIAASDEPRLAANAYARYLGDLSGGQILRSLLGRSLGLGPEALALYAFPAIEDVEMPKRAIRDALDNVAPQGSIADAIIEEAIGAFRHTIALSTALSNMLQVVPAEV